MPTLDKVIFALTLLSALGSGLIAGVFFAFSTFVMKALARLPVPQGVAAMQSINIVVLNPLFLSAFAGTALTCFMAVLLSLFRWQAPGSPCRLAGGLLYVVGCFMVTGMFNVPLNDKLAAVKPKSAQAALVWADYLSNWTTWNHVRGIMAFVAAAALIIALYQQGRQP